MDEDVSPQMVATAPGQIFFKHFWHSWLRLRTARFASDTSNGGNPSHVPSCVGHGRQVVKETMAFGNLRNEMGRLVSQALDRPLIMLDACCLPTKLEACLLEFFNVFPAKGFVMEVRPQDVTCGKRFHRGNHLVEFMLKFVVVSLFGGDAAFQLLCTWQWVSHWVQKRVNPVHGKDNLVECLEDTVDFLSRQAHWDHFPKRGSCIKRTPMVVMASSEAIMSGKTIFITGCASATTVEVVGG